MTPATARDATTPEQLKISDLAKLSRQAGREYIKGTITRAKAQDLITDHIENGGGVASPSLISEYLDKCRKIWKITWPYATNKRGILYNASMVFACKSSGLECGYRI